MRLISYENPNESPGQILLGIVIDGAVYHVYKALGLPPGLTMNDFIKKYGAGPLPDIASAVKSKNMPGTGLDKIKLHAPIPYPVRNVICVGKNYADHAKEVAQRNLQTGGVVLPSAPVYFSKAANPATGDGGIIPVSESGSSMVDYEAELAVVIGKTAKRVRENDAEDYIFGYTILNDVTARDEQTKRGQWHYCKSFDGFCPIGPCVITKDELPLPLELEIFSRVNGETRQKSNTREMIFGIKRLIADYSAGITLMPGDIIATGTPAGIGHAMDPPVYLKKGDKVECGVEKIGVLTSYAE